MKFPVHPGANSVQFESDGWIRPHGQLQFIIDHLGLSRLPPRCMACGGSLRQVDKESVVDRIPSKTRLWLDDYWVCTVCDHLIWQGTHWQRIADQLQGLERL